MAPPSAASGETLTDIKIGKDGATALHDFGGDVAEVLIFDRELSAEETEKVEGYLAHRWGGADSLVAIHTYNKKFTMPTCDEGFAAVVPVPVVPDFAGLPDGAEAVFYQLS